MPEPSTHFARQQEYVFDYDHRASEKHLGGLESIDCGWALVTFLEESSVDRLLTAQDAKSPVLVGKAAQVPLSCQRVDIEKATTSTGMYAHCPHSF